ncbi:MAG: PilZ domain-containing protein [Acidimicrobiales bacterium]
MELGWKPTPGQVALIELDGTGDECLTGVVMPGGEGPVVIDLGASPRPPAPSCEVVASFFTPDALYRMRATASRRPNQDTLIDLAVHEVERVQRRAAPRVRASYPVVMSDLDSSAEPVSVLGETVDIGTGGCRVTTRQPFPPGSDPTVSIRLPNGDTVRALAAIVQASARVEQWEYRIVFLSLEEGDRDRLAELASRATAGA